MADAPPNKKNTHLLQSGDIDWGMKRPKEKKAKMPNWINSWINSPESSNFLSLSFFKVGFMIRDIRVVFLPRTFTVIRRSWKIGHPGLVGPHGNIQPFESIVTQMSDGTPKRYLAGKVQQWKVSVKGQKSTYFKPQCKISRFDLSR